MAPMGNSMIPVKRHELLPQAVAGKLSLLTDVVQMPDDFLRIHVIRMRRRKI